MIKLDSLLPVILIGETLYNPGSVIVSKLKRKKALKAVQNCPNSVHLSEVSLVITTRRSNYRLSNWSHSDQCVMRYQWSHDQAEPDDMKANLVGRNNPNSICVTLLLLGCQRVCVLSSVFLIWIRGMDRVCPYVILSI